MRERLSQLATWSVITALVLVTIDQLCFPFTYAFAFVDAASWMHLVVLSIAGALFCSLFLWFGVAAFLGVSKRLKPRLDGTKFFPTLFAISLTLFLLVVTNQAGGKIFSLAPWWHIVLAILVAGIYSAVLFWVHGKKPQTTPYLFSAALIAMFLFNYIPLLVQGGFGFTGHSQTVMRTFVTSAIVIVTAGIPIVYPIWEWLWERVPAPYLIAILGAAVLNVVNITLYVDNYPEIHTWLAALALGWVFDSVRRKFSEWNPSKATSVLLVGSIVGVGILDQTSHGSNAGYVGAVHTGWTRFTLEMFHHDIGNAKRNARNVVTKTMYRINKRRGIEREIDAFDGLPETFASVEPVEGQRSEGVVVILMDMKRPEWFGAYGGDKSPLTDRCFEDAFVFENAFTIAPKTNVAFPALYTSTYPATRHDNQNTVETAPEWFAYNKDYNIGSLFRSAGFGTSVITNAWYENQFFKRKGGQVFFSGFDRVVSESKDGESHTERFLNAFAENRDVIPETGKYLAVFHIFEHWPEQMPEVDGAVDTICNEIKSKGRWDDTMVILTADHGVQYREHGRTHYGMTLFNEEVHVPLLVHAPTVARRSTRLAHNVSLLDILPTALRYSGVKTEAQFEGRDLFDERSRDIVLETRLLTQPSTALIRDRKKLIRWRKTGHEAFFNLETDPGEITNTLSSDPEGAAAFQQRLDAFLEDRDEMVWP